MSARRPEKIIKRCQNPWQAFPDASHKTDHIDPAGALAPARATSGNSLWESEILLH